MKTAVLNHFMNSNNLIRNTSHSIHPPKSKSHRHTLYTIPKQKLTTTPNHPSPIFTLMSDGETMRDFVRRDAGKTKMVVSER